MGFFKNLNKMLESVSSLCEKAGSYLSIFYGIAVFLLVFSGIVLRLLFSLQAYTGTDWIRPFPWSEELSRWILVALAFTSSSVALKKGEHVGIELLVSAFPEKLKRVVAVLTNLIIIIFLGFCFKLSLVVAYQGLSQTGDIIPLSMFWVKMNLPVGFSFMLIHTISNLVQSFDIEKGVAVCS